QSPQERKKKLISTIVSMVVVILLAFVTAILLKTYVIDTIPVGGDSMLPTLTGGVYHVDDNGKVVPVTKGDTLILNKVAKINCGDIVVFDVDWQSDPLVKRVIAVAGDTVLINNDGKVYVNGVPLEEDYIQGITYTTNGEAELSITVPEGHIFCLGDNRENSHDSRSADIGAIPLENVRGKCFLIINPQGKMRTP
ncbi:MAG: signal peptidase I, partial [Clostridia bacterium]|nr:signal peptidase I [Clostridia bacterium]